MALLGTAARETLCFRCDRPGRPTHRWCNICHAANMRQWRKTHPLTSAQRFKDSARSYAGVYKRRGHIVPEQCRVCGKPAEMHHPDYSKPLAVQWLCREHHLQHHRETRMPMKKVSVTYKAPPNDAKITEMFGHTFFDGKAEEVEVSEAELAKLQNHPLLKCGEASDVEESKKPPPVNPNDPPPPDEGKKDEATAKPFPDDKAGKEKGR